MTRFLSLSYLGSRIDAHQLLSVIELTSRWERNRKEGLLLQLLVAFVWHCLNFHFYFATDVDSSSSCNHACDRSADVSILEKLHPTSAETVPVGSWILDLGPHLPTYIHRSVEIQGTQHTSIKRLHSDGACWSAVSFRAPLFVEFRIYPSRFIAVGISVPQKQWNWNESHGTEMTSLENVYDFMSRGYCTIFFLSRY